MLQAGESLRPLPLMFAPVMFALASAVRYLAPGTAMAGFSTGFSREMKLKTGVLYAQPAVPDAARPYSGNRQPGRKTGALPSSAGGMGAGILRDVPVWLGVFRFGQGLALQNRLQRLRQETNTVWMNNLRSTRPDGGAGRSSGKRPGNILMEAEDQRPAPGTFTGGVLVMSLQSRLSRRKRHWQMMKIYFQGRMQAGEGYRLTRGTGLRLTGPALLEITSVTVEDVLDGADRFSFNLSDPGAKWLDSGLFDPGQEVEIKMGYVDRLTTLLVGEVISLRPGFPSAGTPELEVSGYDLSHQFTRVRRERTFRNMKDSRVVAAIAGEAKHKLKMSMDETATVHPVVIQSRQTDYEFMNMLAGRNFFEFLVRERTLYFRRPQNEKEAAVSLEYGRSLLSFTPEINTAGQVSEVTVRGWNPRTREAIVGRARRGSEQGREQQRESGSELVESIYGKVEERVLDRPVFSQQEADNLARANLNRLSGGLIKGDASCIGIPEIRAGAVVELSGLGKKFSRRYYVERSTHAISSSGYTTNFSVKENTV